MANFLVKWEIEIDAESELEAAKEARKIHLDPGSEAVVFTIYKDIGNHEYSSKPKYIDLMINNEEEEGS